MKGWNRKQHPYFNPDEIFHCFNVPIHDSVQREKTEHEIREDEGDETRKKKE